jgi:TorA maturation chaperone TorD
MATKTYERKLIFLADHLSKYISRYQIKLQANLTEDEYDCVVALLAALLECLHTLVPPSIGN